MSIDICKIVHRKYNYFRDNDHLFPNWKFTFRMWRREFISLMERDGYTESVDKFHERMLKERRLQHERIEYRKNFKRKRDELLGFGEYSNGRSTVYVNPKARMVTFPNRQTMSYDLLLQLPDLQRDIKSYCIIQYVS